jgi:hypothetical protein
VVAAAELVAAAVAAGINKSGRHQVIENRFSRVHREI